MMLGVRRTPVTDVMSALQKAGLIRYRRGHVTVLDGHKLRHRACECHEVSKLAFDRLLGNTPAKPRTGKKHRLVSEVGQKKRRISSLFLSVWSPTLHFGGGI
jgi:hypothetical protein